MRKTVTEIERQGRKDRENQREKIFYLLTHSEMVTKAGAQTGAMHIL